MRHFDTAIIGGGIGGLMVRLPVVHAGARHVGGAVRKGARH